jgi:hypothetical protein
MNQARIRSQNRGGAKPDSLRSKRADAVWGALPARDQNLLLWMLDAEVVTASLAAVLAYGRVRTAQRRLARLTELGLLRSFSCTKPHNSGGQQRGACYRRRHEAPVRSADDRIHVARLGGRRGTWAGEGRSWRRGWFGDLANGHGGRDRRTAACRAVRGWTPLAGAWMTGHPGASVTGHCSGERAPTGPPCPALALDRGRTAGV